MVIRQETEKDYYEVENLTREAFWNVYRPGCLEHLVLHNFRKSVDFVKDLDLVVEENGRIIAHIMYVKASIVADDRNIGILEFGPVSVRPQYQKQGIGSTLIAYSLEKAAEMNFGAVAITGNPDYYHRFGFVSGSSLGVTYSGMPEGEEAPFFMIKELQKDFLKGVKGVYADPDGYNVSETDADVFDKKFPPKEKKVLPGQLG